MLRLFLLGAAAYFAACLALFLLQRKMLFPAPPARAGESAVPGSDAVAVAFEGGDTGAYRAPDRDAAPVAVYFHGNGEDVGQQSDVVQGLVASGAGFLGIEYPGYGRSAGREPNEDDIYAAAEAGIRWLASEGIAPERVVLVGRSLGCGVAIEMADRGHGVGLVLFSPFTSVPAMARSVAPWAPFGFLVRDRFDNLSKGPGIELPALVLHGEDDEVIPFDHGRQVAEALANATFRPLPDLGHNDLPVGVLVPEAVTAVWRQARANGPAESAPSPTTPGG